MKCPHCGETMVIHSDTPVFEHYSRYESSCYNVRVLCCDTVVQMTPTKQVKWTVKPTLLLEDDWCN